ncbi:cytochrome P450 [Pleomassaria siparia CBS 279.74]|uniref:Cytochrome P450 n=1 Tax=Pleomassaria siparia CBS 279.74 TaxID=1314801 RepID=A0A6G1K4M0_9PLEO|nr:cytochrome P450 [Pleomassaria siparia CBS 279.74]
MALSKLLITIGAPVVSAIVYVLCVGYRKRLRIYQLRKQGAMPDGWSWWFGHLLVLDKKLKKSPSDTNVFIAMGDMIDEHADTEYILMDYWPMYQPALMTFSPELAAQVSTKYDLPKPHYLEDSFKPIIGGPSLITMNDKQWKLWRSLFNTGFSASHMLSLVPSLVDSVDVFCEQLQKHVGKDVFPLDDMAMRLTLDIITKTTLDIDLEHQRSEHKLARALNTILDWHSFWDPRVLLNPFRRPVQWYYGRIIDLFIKEQLQKRFEEMQVERASLASDQLKKAKSVIALALEDYMAQNYQSDKQAYKGTKLDPEFATIAANQIRMFIFAGNDSTASTLVYAYHLLSKNPLVMARLRQEHDTVFGLNNSAGDRLRKDPALINQCRYTLAVIKETLRLFPPSSSLRDGVAGTSIVDAKGNLVPTGNLNVTIMHRFVHIHPRFWPQPLEFLPERWLVEPGHELYPKSVLTAYRPFEHGSRNCIAQTLVYNELRVALILTAPRFNIEPAYDEWDADSRSREGLFTRLMRSVDLKGEECKTVSGERAYQTTRSGAHPADRYPCRVSLA